MADNALKRRNAVMDQARVAVARDPALVRKAQEFAQEAGEFSASAPVESQVADYLLANDDGYKRAYKELSDLQQTSKLAPHDRYKRLAGEAEARAVQSRMNLNPQQRRELFPLDSYDVPINGLLYR